MRIEDFDYPLPRELIAQEPLPERDASRLLTLRPGEEGVRHRQFKDLVEELGPGELLVLNDAQVIRARLLGVKVPTGGRVELLLVRPEAPSVGAVRWRCLGQASKGIREGAELAFGEAMRGRVLEALGEGEYLVEFVLASGEFEDALAAVGRLPLPPYIQREPEASDLERYQTVFARQPGSVAAPTAGLHFTPQLLDQLRARGVELCWLTLDVGPGTFLPIRDGDIEGHRMHRERFRIPVETAGAVERARREGRAVLAVGTTVVRALESAWRPGEQRLQAGSGETELFIKPGFRFELVDGLVTNFHLPRSTLLMLVCAFFGTERTRSAYEEAVRERYRFFSYGDVMFGRRSTP